MTHAQLRHKSIIPLLGVFREPEDIGPPMMVLPFMENSSAMNYIETLPEANVADATAKIVRILYNASPLARRSLPIRYATSQVPCCTFIVGTLLYFMETSIL